MLELAQRMFKKLVIYKKCQEIAELDVRWINGDQTHKQKLCSYIFIGQK